MEKFERGRRIGVQSRWMDATYRTTPTTGLPSCRAQVVDRLLQFWVAHIAVQVVYRFLQVSAVGGRTGLRRIWELSHCRHSIWTPCPVSSPSVRAQRPTTSKCENQLCWQTDTVPNLTLLSAYIETSVKTQSNNGGKQLHNCYFTPNFVSYLNCSNCQGNKSNEVEYYTIR